jgi:DNA replication licensing factor MCM4
MRKLGITSKTVSATPRQLDSMIRISEALARMRLSGIVEERDVVEAVQLINDAMLQTAVDPATGMVNMDQILLGTGARTKERQAQMREVIEKLLNNNAEIFQKGIAMRVMLEQIRETLGDDSFTDDELRPLLYKLESENLIILVTSKVNPIIKLSKPLK